MKTLEAIEQRRSIKKYNPNHKLTQKEIDTLMSHAILSPTSFNMQNWRFVLIQDKVKQEEIKNISWGQTQVSDCSLLVVICADLKAWAKNPERYWEDAPESIQEMIVPMIGKFYANNKQLERDEAMRSGGIAAQTIMLSAKEMGYDTCPMVGYDAGKLAEIINLPEDHIICMMITVGKSVSEASQRSGQLDIKEVVFENSF